MIYLQDAQMNCFFNLIAIIFFVFLLMFILKLWFVIVIAVVIFLLISKDSKLKNKLKGLFKSGEAKIKAGETYKECEYCGQKNDRSFEFCSKCGRQL